MARPVVNAPSPSDTAGAVLPAGVEVPPAGAELPPAAAEVPPAVLWLPSGQLHSV